MTIDSHTAERTAPFQTSDLSLAAFLLARGLPLERVTGEDRHRVFCFPANADAEARSYYANAPIAARQYANALRDLKAIIRDS